LRDPDLDTIVKLSFLECFAQLCEDDNIKLRALERIGLCFKKMREAGPDPYHVEYSQAELLDIDIRNALKDEVRWLMDELDEMNLPETAFAMEDDVFLEYLINNIRNEVISYQSFISKTINISYKKLTEKIVDLKVLSNHLKGGWRVYSFNPCC
jgi:hypothetical protein